MDTQTNQVSKETQDANQAPSQEEVKPLFSGTDSQGKERLFTNPEEAQQSWQSAQNFIKEKVTESKSLESRIQELEAQLNQSTKLDDALKQLNTKEESPVIEEQTQQATESTPQLNMEQLEQQLMQKVMSKLSASQQEEVYAKNQQESIGLAQSVYGDSYEAKLREAAQELGMSDEDIIKEAQSNPKRFKKLFNLDRQPNRTFAPSGGGITGMPQSNERKLTLNGGFTGSQKFDSHMANLQSIAKSKGLDIKF